MFPIVEIISVCSLFNVAVIPKIYGEYSASNETLLNNDASYLLAELPETSF